MNGAAVTSLLLSPGGLGRDDETGEDEEKDKEYFLDIRTEAQRTSLATDGSDSLWIYGQVQCNDPEVDTDALTRGIRFTPEGANVSWFKLGEPQMTGGFKAVRLRAQPPGPEAELRSGEDFVRVGTLIEGKDVSGRVQFELLEQYYLEFV